jgi:hypothetical protein
VSVALESLALAPEKAQVSPAALAIPKRTRDPRLDVVRGIALFIIFIAHVPSNWLWSVIPARFGLSDATDSFVFISGIASAIAFGGTFLRHGFWTGVGRIAYRCAQLTVAHLFLLFAIVGVAYQGGMLTGRDLVGALGVGHLLASPAQAISEAFWLHWVPASLDIMPVYIVLLAMVPAIMLLEKLDRRLPLLASLALYLANAAYGLDPIADSSTGRHWLLNPFAWQVIFFLGFGFKRGWLPVPPRSLALTILAWVIVGVGVIYRVLPEGFGLGDAPLWQSLGTQLDKTNVDPFRLAHFLATAYLLHGLLLAKPEIARARILRPFERLGQQGLSVFVGGMIAANIAGLIVLAAGDGLIGQIIINLGGFLALYGIARLMAWYKSAPWGAKKS